MPHVPDEAARRSSRSCHPEGLMSDLSRRPGSRLSRSARERRAFQLVVISGGAGVVAVVTFLLAVLGVMGYGIFLLALVVAVVAGLLFRRSVGR
jgi:hypothetical protein